jgi:invasion protein IalB
MLSSRRIGLAAFMLAIVAPPTGLLARPAQADAVKAPARPVAAAPPASEAAAPVPQQTTATFGDWTLRCARTAAATQSCEVVQGISSGERAVAQIALGRLAKDQPMHMVILVPPNVALAAPPTLTLAHDGDAPAVALTWRRCLPGNCMADAELSEEQIRRLRGATEAGRISFTDGNGQVATLPFSSKGLSPALDGLAKESGG